MNKRPELDQVNPPGQIVNYPIVSSSLPEPKRGTLGEYIDKTLKHEAMLDYMARKKKLSFEEWLHYRFPAGVEGHAHMLNQGDLEQCWKAAQENI